MAKIMYTDLQTPNPDILEEEKEYDILFKNRKYHIKFTFISDLILFTIFPPKKLNKSTQRRFLYRSKIENLRKKCYRELSGGQQQRVLLARALCATQKMLLLDEPVSGLDPIVTKEMYALIEELHKDGITIIMISHDIEAAKKYATHILHIGKNIFFGTKEEYIARKMDEEA